MRSVLILTIISIMGCSDAEFKKPLFVRDIIRQDITLCGTEGVLIREGYDQDYNGQISDDELTNSSYICDGIKGENGQDAFHGITEVIDPCGDGPGADEVLIITAQGEVIAWYSDLGLSILEENINYTTTDAQKCKFKIEDSKVVEL